MNLRGERHARDGWKLKLYAYALVCIPIPGIAATPFDPLIACTELKEDVARLACFDREMVDVRKSIPRPAARVAPSPEQQFGLSDKQVLGLEGSPAQAAAPTALHAHIVRVSQTAGQRQVFSVDNAQTWQQIELDPDFAVSVGQEVKISKGALGSFWLATDSHHATRVKRIQ